MQVGEVDGHGDEAADDDAREDEAGFADGEAVHGRVDKGEDLEEGVVDAVDEGGVGVYEEDLYTCINQPRSPSFRMPSIAGRVYCYVPRGP